MSSVPTKQIDGDVAVGHNVTAGGSATIRGNVKVGHDVTIEGWLNARNIRGAGKGLYETADRLNEAYPKPQNGWWALVGNTLPANVYRAWGGEWGATGETGGDFTMEWDKLEEVAKLLDEETAEREAADTELKTNVEAEAAARKSADDVEAEARTEGDKILKTAITDEETARKSADDVEAEARTEGDKILKTAITDEETARKSADEELKSSVEEVQSIAEGVVGSIDVSEIDNIPASRTDALAMAKDMKHSRWTLTYNSQFNVGVIDMFSDSMLHQLTEVMTTHYAMDSEGVLDFTGHTDTTIYRYWRSYKIQDSSNLENEAGTWTAWAEAIPETVKTGLTGLAASVENEAKNRSTADSMLLGEIRANTLNIDNEAAARKSADDAESEARTKADEAQSARLLALEGSVWPLEALLAATPQLAEYTGADVDVTLSWSLSHKGQSTEPSSLRLTMDGVELPLPSLASGSVSVKVSKKGKTQIALSAEADGLSTESEASVTLVMPVYAGFASTETASELDMASSLSKNAPRTSAAGTYTVTSLADGNYFWLCVPEGMSVKRVTLNGFDVPMESGEAVDTELGCYTCYKSSNKLVKGDYTFKVE